MTQEDVDALLLAALIFAALVIVGAFYFIPSMIAVLRKHRNTLAIVILNLALGWTLIGWIAALIWAVHQDKSQ